MNKGSMAPVLYILVETVKKNRVEIVGVSIMLQRNAVTMFQASRNVTLTGYGRKLINSGIIRLATSKQALLCNDDEISIGGSPLE